MFSGLFMSCIAHEGVNLANCKSGIVADMEIT